MAEIDHEDAFPEGLPSRKGKTDKEEFYERFPRLPREYSTEDIQAITPAKKTTDASSALQDIQKFIGEDQYTKWRKQGEIGGIENARRKRSNLMGDLVNLATAGTPEIAAMGGNKSIPEIFRSPTARMIRLENAAKRYQKGKYEDQDEKGDGEKLREADAQMLLDFLMELEEERVRGTSIAGDIAAGYVELPQFMLSFVLSGGLGSLAQQGVRRGLAGWVRGTATEAGKRSVKEGVKRGVKRTIRGAAEFSAKTAAQTLAMPQEVYRNYAKRSAMSNFDVTDKGWSVLDSAKESPATNLLKAVGDVLIEVGSESAGHYLNKMMPRGLREGLEKMYLLKNPGGNPKDLWNRIAFNGMIAEIGEEQLGDYMRALTGIEDFGAENPDSILERLVASQYGWRELFVTAGVIAPLSVGYSIHNRQVAKKRSDTFHVREQQIQEIVAAAEKQQLRTSSDVETDLEKSSERVASAKTRAEKEAAILEQKELKTEHEEKISRERALVVEGRVAKLTADINATEEELVRLEKQLEEAAKQGKSTTNLEQQIAKQQEKFDLLDEQIAEIQLDSKAALGERKQEREAASSLSTTVAGFRKKVKGKEVTVTHGDMKAAKKDATKAVKSSTLSADEQAAAIESFTHETDPKALAQTLGKISRRLNNIAKGIRGGDEILTTPSRVMATVLHRARTTRRLTQEEGKAARAALIDALNRSDLTKDQKAEFLTTIKNIDTFDKLMKELPSILERVVAKEEELKRSRLLATIRRRLSGAHPKMRSGKPVGKLTPELQKRLKKIEEFSEFDEEQRDNRLFANIQALDTDTLAGVELTDEMRTELRLDNAIISLVANIDGKNSQELEGILKEVNAIILQGKSLYKAKVEAENVRKKELVDNSLKSISFRDGAIKDLKALAAKIKEWTTQKITRSTLFHGSSIEIQELVDDVYTSGNIYGQGFYTTDDADIALGYTKKGSKKAATDGTYAPTVYSIEVKGAPVLYDMETPMGMELIEELRGKHKHLSWLLSSSNVDETTTLRSIYDRIRSRSKQRLITVDRAQEMFAAFRKSLEDRGYDGLQHTGGLLTGNKPHKVSIFFSPTKSVKLHKIDAASAKEGTPIEEKEAHKEGKRIERGLETINAVLADARITKKAKKALVKKTHGVENYKQLEKLNREVLDALQDSVPTSKGVYTKIKQRLKSAAHNFQSAWEDFMDIITIDTPGTKTYQSLLAQFTNVREIETQVKYGTMQDAQDYVNMGIEAFGLKSEGQLNKQLERDGKRELILTGRDAKGNRVNLKLTKSEARKIWMELQDPLIRADVMSDRGGYHIGNTKIEGLTIELEADILAMLSPQDIKFARGQMKMYRDLHKKINSVYEEFYNVSLPFNEFYSPIQRRLTKERTASTFFDEVAPRLGATPTYLKSRTANYHLVRVQSDHNAMMRHITEVNHWVNWAGKLRDLKTIFGDGDIQDAINRDFGSGIMKGIKDHIMSFEKGGYNRAQVLEGFWNKLRMNYTSASLMLKPFLFAKQQASILAYADFIPAKDFVMGSLDFFTNPVKNFKLLKELSPLFATRAKYMERDIADVLGSEEFASFKKIQSLKNHAMLFTKAGDQLAIAIGGWAVYRHAIKNGASQADAIKAFEKATAETQQSSDLSQLSLWQKGNSAQKLFTMYMTAQASYLRKEVGAMRAMWADKTGFLLGKGKISRTAFAKKIAIYHFALPMLFQAISDLGWDEDEQKRAAILGSLNGVFIFGDILDELIRHALNDMTEAELATYGRGSAISPVFDNVLEIYSAFDKMDMDDLSTEESLEALHELLEIGVETTTGLGYERFKDIIEAGSGIMEGDEPMEAWLRMGGMSPYAVEKRFGKDEFGF